MSEVIVISKTELENLIVEQINKAVLRLEECLVKITEQQKPQQKECENLSVEALCKRWNISKGTVRNYVKQGLIKSVKFNRRVLFPIDAVLRAEANGLNRF